MLTHLAIASHSVFLRIVVHTVNPVNHIVFHQIIRSIYAVPLNIQIQFAYTFRDCCFNDCIEIRSGLIGCTGSVILCIPSRKFIVSNNIILLIILWCFGIQIVQYLIRYFHIQILADEIFKSGLAVIISVVNSKRLLLPYCGKFQVALDSIIVGSHIIEDLSKLPANQRLIFRPTGTFRQPPWQSNTFIHHYKLRCRRNLISIVEGHLIFVACTIIHPQYRASVCP